MESCNCPERVPEGRPVKAALPTQSDRSDRSETTQVENPKMNVLTYSEARAGFKQAMDDVCRDHTPMMITRQSGEHVVMVSLEDFNAMQETLYLLSSPKNAERLARSIAQVKAGKAIPRNLLNNEQTEEPQQRGRKG
ncbi:antitoxin YefM [Paraburkholderia sp. GAS42]|jgi:antitoxin YefM